MQTEPIQRLRDIASAQELPAGGDLVESLAEVCMTPGAGLGESDTALLGDILRQLVRDVEMPVRRALADQLSDRADAPSDLIVLLANDVVDVAYPVLAKSPILQDQDLIEIIASHAREHALAISRRDTINATVGDALVETGDSEIIVSLIENDGAALSARTMDALVGDSKGIEAYRAPLLGRKDLSLDMAMRMADWVGESLRHYIAERFDLNEDSLGDAVSEAVLEAIDSDIFSDRNAADAPGKAGDGPRLLHALEHDDVALFKRIFEGLCGLDSRWAETSLYSTGETLAIACKAIGLERETFSRILCHLQTNDVYDSFKQSKLYSRMTRYFDNIEAANADRVLSKWRLAT